MARQATKQTTQRAAGAPAQRATSAVQSRRAKTTLRWSHVALNCRDQDETEAFYRDLFGFHRARVVQLGDERIIFLRSGEVYLELFLSRTEPVVPTEADGPDHVNLARHLAFQTEDLDVFLDRANGSVEVSLGPLHFDDFIPGWRSVWLRDPNGVIVEVSQGFRDE